MSSITPCRHVVSDRFPVASFVVRVPPARCFEVAWSTDARLFQPEYRGSRTIDNFHTTRGRGLLRAPAGETTVILPPAQLRRFAGAQRLYYALGTYEGPRGEDARFTACEEPAEMPYVQLAGDFTGRSLAPLGSEGASDAYGTRPPELVWGRDLASVEAATPTEYDDGFGSELWNRRFGGRSGYGFVVSPAEVQRARREVHPDDYDAVGDGGFEPEPPAAPPVRRPRAVVDPDAYDAFDDDEEEEGAYADDPSDPDAYPTEIEPRRHHGVHVEEIVVHERVTEVEAFGRGGGEPAGLEEPPSAGSWGGRGVEEPPGLEEPAPAWGGRAHRADDVPGYEDLTHAQESRSAWGNPGVARRPLTPQEMTRIVRPVFRLNGGLDGYARCRPDVGGLVWGMVGFNARDGSLREVLEAAWQRDQAWYGGSGRTRFEDVFGTRRASALARYVDRRDPSAWSLPVDEQPLDAPAWVEQFRAAGSLHRQSEPIPPERDPFKVAQNEVAIRRHLVPALPAARELGLSTDRGLAILFERAVDLGLDGATRWLRGALGSGGTERARLERAAATGEAQGRPWASRVRALCDSPDLDDTSFDLDA